jgi:hypothetical protein
MAGHEMMLIIAIMRRIKVPGYARAMVIQPIDSI